MSFILSGPGSDCQTDGSTLTWSGLQTVSVCRDPLGSWPSGNWQTHPPLEEWHERQAALANNNDKRELPWGQLVTEGVAIVVSILLAFAIDAAWAPRRDEARLTTPAFQGEFRGSMSPEPRHSWP